MTRNAPIRKSIVFFSIENKNVVYGLEVKFVKKIINYNLEILIHFYIFQCNVLYHHPTKECTKANK